MADKMLIDATHPEETRVVVLRGNRVEEFDFESANRKQLRGNIYLAKVTRVEPSLQAAFVDYGGDRQARLDEEQRAQKDADDDADHRAGGRRGGRNRHRHRGADRQRSRDVLQSAPVAGEEQPTQEFAGEVSEHPAAEAVPGQETAAQIVETAAAMPTYEPLSPEPEAPEQAGEVAEISGGEAATEPAPMPEGEAHGETGEHADAEAAPSGEPGAQGNGNGDDHHEEEAVESVGGADALEEARMPRFRRQYKIQEVIKRRQVMLVQVVKEERGTKAPHSPHISRSPAAIRC